MTTGSPGRDRAEALTKEGIAAYRAGQRQQAMACFVAATQADRTFAPAWLWLAEVQAAPEDKRACLEQVLLHNPHHKQALAELRRLPADQLLHRSLTPRVLSHVAPLLPPAPNVTSTPAGQSGASSLSSGYKVVVVTSGAGRIVLSFLLLLMVLLCAAIVYAAVRPGAPMYAAQLPPEGWHQISGDDGVRLWLPPNFAGGNRAAFKQIMVDLGFAGNRIANRMGRAPDDALLVFDEFTDAPDDVYVNALSYVEKQRPNRTNRIRSLEDFATRYAGHSAFREASREMHWLGPQGTISALRLWFEPLRENDYPQLVYAFKHDGAYWMVTFSLRYPTPDQIAECDLIVRTLSINVEP